MAERLTDDGATHRAAPIAATRLAIGVTGHRPDRLPDSSAALIRAQLVRVFRRIAELAPESPPTVVLSLAEGADRIAAEVAGALGFPIIAVLPFQEGEFARDFADAASIADYEALVDAAAEVIELPGARAELGANAYARAGDLIVARCDVLVAVWDGGAPRGPGGTPALVELALESGRPVVWIPTTPELPIRVLTITGAERRGRPLAGLAAALPAPGRP